MNRGALVTLAVVTVVIGTVILGQIIANARADEESAGIGQAERAAVAEAAHLFWDNPFQRMVFRAYGLRAIATGGPDQCGGGETGPLFEVTAYTLFGIELDAITCRAAPDVGDD
jgi:hypothetical protein